MEQECSSIIYHDPPLLTGGGGWGGLAGDGFVVVGLSMLECV